MMFRLLRGEWQDLKEDLRSATRIIRTSRGVDRWLMVGLIFNPAFWLVAFSVKWVFAVLFAVRDCCQASPNFDVIPPHVQLSWLERQVTIEEAEHANSSYPGQPRIDGLPFGYLNRYWRSLRIWMKEGDQLWYYHSHHEYAPEWGYAVVRDGQPVARMQTSPEW